MSVSATGIGVALVYTFADNTQLLFRISELLGDGGKIVEYMIHRHGGVMNISAPRPYSSLSLAEKKVARASIQQRLDLVKAARDAYFTAQREKEKLEAA